MIINIFLIIVGKIFSKLSSIFNLGSGSTWPGHIALSVNKNFIKDLLKSPITNHQSPITILIAGTNGKTTTAKLIRTILEKNGNSVFQNEAGANLLNGIASTLIQYSNKSGKIKKDFAIFEIDENTLPLALKEVTPDYVVLLNLFRDQLDRYGEVDTIARKWKDTILQLPPETTLILNADDPQIAYLGKSFKGNTLYFGLNEPSLAVTTHQHAVDSIYCLNCGSKLTYKTTYFSHVGDWKCENCGEKRPKVDLDQASNYPLSGVYNQYNTLAAVLLCKTIGVNEKIINSALNEFSPAFGRQEIIEIDGKKVQIFLSKNPTSFNESLRTVRELEGKNILLILNDRIPDGRDISWIWDVDFEEYLKNIKNIYVSGDRCYDMGLRMKYTIQNSKFKIQNFSSKVKIYENLNEAITFTLKQTSKNDVLYILPTYSAMLEIRKILTGKSIL